jgi:hypothetical protein
MLRDLGGMAQPNRRAVPHRVALVLGFQDSDAMTFHVVIGAVVAALAAFEAWSSQQGDLPPGSEAPTHRQLTALRSINRLKSHAV